MIFMRDLRASSDCLAPGAHYQDRMRHVVGAVPRQSGRFEIQPTDFTDISAYKLTKAVNVFKQAGHCATLKSGQKHGEQS